MTLTKHQAQLRAEDRPWTDDVITEVTRTRSGYSIRAGSSGFLLARKHLNGVKPPKVGDQIALYTVLGSTVRGIDLRGVPLFYKTQEELDAEHEEWCKRHEERQKKDFEKNRRKLDRQFASLPDVFQRRISWFRAWNPNFRWKHEAYELSACVDAVKIATAMKTPKGVESFRKMKYETQRAKVPDLYDGHSGNSFSVACRLAWLYLTNPILVVAEHGAMTPLTGCEEYGCMHPRPDDVIAAVKDA